VTESSLVALSRRLDAPSRLIGRWFRWLAVALVLVQLVVVVARYVFAYSNPMLQEAVLYTNATLFMACAGYAYWIDAHVRVDITLLLGLSRAAAPSSTWRASSSGWCRCASHWPGSAGRTCVRHGPPLKARCSSAASRRSTCSRP
jgi:hypothetical protein